MLHFSPGLNTRAPDTIPIALCQKAWYINPGNPHRHSSTYSSDFVTQDFRTVCGRHRLYEKQKSQPQKVFHITQNCMISLCELKSDSITNASFSLIRLATVKKLNKILFLRLWGNRYSHTLLVAEHNDTTPIKDILAVFLIVTNVFTLWPSSFTSGMHLTDTSAHIKMICV